MWFRAISVRRSMTLFTQVLNPMTGQSEWQGRNGDDYDYNQEIANAGFGDMLHDRERNNKFNSALQRTIQQMHAVGRQAHVLDIGTGTGVLAMMALAAGADSVTACEAFQPMADCAERILGANGVAERVRLVKKRSTEMRVGVDMPVRANLLVAELLDTELIGEGAISIYNHAHAELLTADALCIPARARCYAQVAQSPLGVQFNSLKLLANLDGDTLLRPPPAVLKCRGDASALHDVQLSQLPAAAHFRLLTEPALIFEFDFSCKLARPTQRCRRIALRSLAGGSTDLVFFWWAIDMDAEAAIQLSCAPYWAHPDTAQLAATADKGRPLANVVPWRDHWMQSIYYVPHALNLPAAGTEFQLSCQHDEYSWWFDALAADAAAVADDAPPPRHSCDCGLHQTYARNRIGQLNQTARNKRYLRHLEDTIVGGSRVLCLGDGSLLGLSAAALGAANVICHEPHSYSRRFMAALVQHNQLEAHTRFVDSLDALLTEDDGAAVAQLTHVFAEPYFLTAILPWENFRLGRLLRQLTTRLPPTVAVTPHSARLYALPVEFLDLHKIRAPIGCQCEGLDLRLFDKMVAKATALAQAKVEAQPLWEYPCRALASPQELLRVTFSSAAEEQPQHTSGSIPIEASGSCNGIALWVDWHLDDSASPKTTVSQLAGPIVVGAFVQWDMFVRQGVHLCQPSAVDSGDVVGWTADYQPSAATMEFSFVIKSDERNNEKPN